MLLTTPRAGSSAAPARVSRPEWIALAALLPMLAVWAAASHGIAHDYAKRTRLQIAPLQVTEFVRQHRAQLRAIQGQRPVR